MSYREIPEDSLWPPEPPLLEGRLRYPVSELEHVLADPEQRSPGLVPLGNFRLEDIRKKRARSSVIEGQTKVDDTDHITTIRIVFPGIIKSAIGKVRRKKPQGVVDLKIV